MSDSGGATMTQDNKNVPIGLISEDSNLTMALASVLGSEFALVAQPRAGKERQEVSRDQAGGVILDIDSSDGRSETGESLFQRLTPSGIPIVILASDENRVQALRLVELGAHGHVRKPPVVGEL